MKNTLKKYFIFWVVFCQVQSVLSAQSNLKMGFSVSPTFASMKYKGRYITEKWYPSFVGNLNIGWLKKEHVSYRMGVAYSYLKSDVSGYERLGLRFTHQELVLPFDFYLSYKEQKYNHWSSNIGLALAMGLDKKAYNEPYSNQDQAEIPYRFMEIFATVGTGYTHHINPSTSLVLNLNFRSNLLNQVLIILNGLYFKGVENINLPPSVYTLGLECGLWFK
jgi:hypothetical protein